jgi:hypothetical protein
LSPVVVVLSVVGLLEAVLREALVMQPVDASVAGSLVGVLGIAGSLIFQQP